MHPPPPRQTRGITANSTHLTFYALHFRVEAGEEAKQAPSAASAIKLIGREGFVSKIERGGGG